MTNHLDMSPGTYIVEYNGESLGCINVRGWLAPDAAQLHSLLKGIKPCIGDEMTYVPAGEAE